MKPYPSISGSIIDLPIYAFDKLDGQNVRAEWSRKRGIHKFGKRHHLLDDSCPFLAEAKGHIVDRYAEDLGQVFKDAQWDRAVAYFEFFGPSSFAGVHAEEPHEVVLIDVAGPKGILEPRDFLDMFGHLKTAALLYQGNPSSPFLEEVRTGTLAGMTFEGVVCKGKWKHPGLPWMFKVKNHAWYEKLRERYAGDEKTIQSLM